MTKDNTNQSEKTKVVVTEVPPLVSSENDDEKSRSRLTCLIGLIKSRLYLSQKEIADNILIKSPSALTGAKSTGTSRTIELEYIPNLIRHLQKEGVDLPSGFEKQVPKVENPSEPVGNAGKKGDALVTGPIEYEKFIEEVLQFPEGERGEVKILGTWLLSLYGSNKAAPAMEKMIASSQSVRVLLAKPEGRFLEDRIRILSNITGTHRQSHEMVEVYDCLDRLIELKAKHGGLFDFRVYDTNPGARMFIHKEKIYMNMLLTNEEANDVFTTVYPNDGSLSAQQMNGHFDTLWEQAKPYEKPETPLDPRPIGSVAGTYKVYTYGHSKTGRTPSIVLGALQISANGLVVQKTYNSQNANNSNLQLNEGWASRIGSRLYIEVQNMNAPKLRGFLALSTKDFSANPGNLITGVISVFRRNQSIPVAMRIVLERTHDSVKFDEMEVKKFPLSNKEELKAIPQAIHKFFSGIFRNMIRYHITPISSMEALEEEMRNERADLGEILYAYALNLLHDKAHDDKIISALRWAYTHGFEDDAKAQADFKEFKITEQDGVKIIERKTGKKR